MQWDDDLAGVARRIAETDASPLRVAAGPGTGKTYSLTRRVMRLLQEGVAPTKIMVCTFTRTAAEDMKKALHALDVEGVELVRAGTIHSFCFELLAKTEVLAITHRVPRTLLDFEKRFMLEDICSDAFGGIRECEKRVRAFESAWARLQDDIPGAAKDQLDLDFQDALLGWLKFHQAMLIGEAVPEALRYLQNNPASPYRGIYEHVLVDEYQDLNRAEQVLLDTVAEGATFAIIGDEDQAIYSFKFAHPQGITTFPDTHPGTADETLDQCRRCPALVVDMANSLIAHNTGREPRKLTADPGNPDGEVQVVQWRSLEAETQGIAKFIVRRIQSGAVKPGQVLVLSPRRRFGYALWKALDERGVTAHSFFTEQAFDGDLKKLNDCKAEQAFALLTLLANPDDRVALRCWCGFGSPSLRKGAWKRLRIHCEQSGESPRVALERLTAGTLSLPQTGDLVARFRELQQRLDELSEYQGKDLLDALMPPDEPSSVLLRSAIKEEEVENADARKLLDVVRTMVTQPELPTDVDFVRIMSLHKSKGLSADMVVVLGCMDGLVPFVPPNETDAEQAAKLQEQRRLFYVAITRARSTLILSSAHAIPIADAHRLQVPFKSGPGGNATTIASRFISELGPRCPSPISGDMFLAKNRSKSA